MKNFIYINSNLSGIGDRLLDIMLIYTHALYLKCDNLYVEWRINDETNKTIITYQDGEQTTFGEDD